MPVKATTKELYNEVKRVIEADRNAYTNIRLHVEGEVIDDGTIKPIRLNKIQSIDDGVVIIVTCTNRGGAWNTKYNYKIIRIIIMSEFYINSPYNLCKAVKNQLRKLTKNRKMIYFCFVNINIFLKVQIKSE